MRCLVVHAHPLDHSLTRHFCDVARRQLEADGHEIDYLDLYAAGFDPCLSAAERASHHAITYDHGAVQSEVEQLRRADAIVLVFPTWWFGLPAILKGWIDRVFAPGVAFAQDENFGPIRPLLSNLKQVVAITTLGSPWWADWLVLRRPLRAQLRKGVFLACAPRASFAMLSFYRSENPSKARVTAFSNRIAAACARLRG